MMQGGASPAVGDVKSRPRSVRQPVIERSRSPLPETPGSTLPDPPPPPLGAFLLTGLLENGQSNEAALRYTEHPASKKGARLERLRWATNHMTAANGMRRHSDGPQELTGGPSLILASRLLDASGGPNANFSCRRLDPSDCRRQQARARWEEDPINSAFVPSTPAARAVSGSALALSSGRFLASMATSIWRHHRGRGSRAAASSSRPHVRGAEAVHL
ncbi:hypothetical protein TARUN_7653 [Trichoderma arundinaceum]|uniref:Uncharacterized protein n=1 Tax=Trichoderma arundinaceum TaxID=490622 RepID=A0A395NFJ5_TRIAR|nr:hypothetical protein TARUN_7653 [Trichoderma arundinaceum]